MGHKFLADPGDAGIIRPNADLQLCEMVSATAETRTLANPTKVGIRFVLRLLTDGGTVTVTAAAGFNVDLETEATFADAGDLLSLVSVALTPTTYRWEVMEGNTGVTLA
jgi:hypothetical protein